MRQDPTVTAYVPKAKGKGKKNSSGARCEESKKKKEKETCKRCGENHLGKCKYSNSTCTDAGRKVTWNPSAEVKTKVMIS